MNAKHAGLPTRPGEASSRTGMNRRLHNRNAEDEAVFSVMRAEQEVREGKIVYGDLREILNKMP